MDQKMNHLRFAYVLIAIVLACPYMCMEEVSGSASGTCASGCGCSQSQPGHESPGAPSEHDPDCLCHGAVVDGETRTSDLGLAEPPAINWLVADNGAESSSLHFSIAFEPSHHFPPFCTGRDVCALTCTLLI